MPVKPAPIPGPSPKPIRVSRRTERGTRLATAIMGAALAVLVGYLGLFRMGQAVVSLSYDMPFMVHRPGSEDRVRMVYLSDHSGESLDRRPQAQLLDRLGEAGAQAVVYDIIFDREHADPQVDLAFAAAIRRFRGVDAEGRPIPGRPQRHVLLACGRETNQTTGIATEHLLAPIDVLLDAADDFGVVAVDDDSYMVRKLPTGTRDEPSLVWKAALAVGTKLEESDRLVPRWINFAGPPPDLAACGVAVPVPCFGAASLLDGKFNPALFRDKIIVVGGQPGIFGEIYGKDLFITPFHRFEIGGKLPPMSGVEVQANALANLLQGNWLTRTGDRFEFGLILVAGLLLGAGFTLLRPARALLVAGGVVVAASLAGVLSMRFANQWFPWSVVAFLQAPVAVVWGVAAQSYVERFFRIKLTKDQAAIRAAFAKYLSPQMLERLTTEGFHTNLGGEKIHVAMMFTDLEAFTDMCERINDPQRTVEILNDYFERTTGCIVDDDGIIIKFIGDAIFAAWGAPLPDPAAPVKAVRAAWRLFENKLVVDGDELKTRIGLHFGEVVAGNVGSSRRVDYTLIGDAVNLAARLEGINKLFDTCILLSGAVHQHLDNEFHTRRIGTFRVKGRRDPVAVYELLGPSHQEEAPPWIGDYHQALAALEANDIPLALERFTAVNANRGRHGDGPSRFFIERLRIDGSIRDGIVELKEK